MNMQERPDVRLIAETEQIGRLLNCLLRERGIPEPTAGAGNTPCMKEMPPAMMRQLLAEGSLISIELASAGVVLIGAAAYISPFGHHRYGQRFWGASPQAPFVYEPLDFEQLVRLILSEAAAAEQSNPKVPDQSGNRIASLLEQIDNSMRGMTAYAANRRKHPVSLWSLAGAERTIAAEQSLLFGHPFHPSPKSLEGFSEDDIRRYAPELGASFPLYYFAAAPELIREEWAESPDPLFPAAVTDEARRLLPEERKHYRLLPSHPWQAQYLKCQPAVQELLQSGRLADLGELGEKLFPTSSIRTVWDFRHPIIYKLPLHVRVTNFIRVNPLEQLKRSVDVSRAIAAIAGTIPYSGFHIMLERGYLTLALPDGGQQSAMLQENFGVLFRESPVGRTAVSAPDQEGPAVVASLLERPMSSSCSALWEAISGAARAERAEAGLSFAGKWLDRYLSISFIPLLWLFVERGVSMEAHVQNSLVSLNDGWPSHFYVRDLEGVSICRNQGIDWHPAVLPADSPACYSASEAWKRFKYYVLVNHIGHLIHTIALDGGLDEVQLWQCVGKSICAADFMAQEKHRFYRSDLLDSPALPAKANLASYFRNMSEKPLYVNISNPLAAARKVGVPEGRMV